MGNRMKITLTRREKGIGILAAALVAALAVPPPLYALFGAEDTVEMGPGWQAQWTSQFTVFGHIWSQDISNYAKLIETVQSLEKIYAEGEQVYALEQQMSSRFGAKTNWEMLATGVVTNLTRNQYGESVNLAAVLNGNPAQAVTAYGNAALPLSANVNLSNEVLGLSQHLARLATVEAMDGTNQSCLQAVAQYRANQQVNQTPFSFLNNQATDMGAGTNTTMAQLNLLNGGQSQLRAEQVSQSTLQSCLVEEQIWNNKLQRDNQVAAFNTYAAVQQKYQSNPMMLSNMSTSLDADIQ